MSDRQTVPELMDQDDVVDLLIRAARPLIRDLFDEVEKASAEERPEAFQRAGTAAGRARDGRGGDRPSLRPPKIDGGKEVVDDRLAEEHEAKQLLMRWTRPGRRPAVRGEPGWRCGRR